MKNKIFIILFCILFITGSFSLYLLLTRKKEKEINLSVFETNISSRIDKFNFKGLEEKNITLSETLKITTSAIYNLSGELKDGYIHVETEGNVKLVLNGVNITNNNGPAIYVKKAKNVEIVIKENTNNYLNDATYYYGLGKDVDACIYSESDLLISGSGNLEIKANYKDGIISKDDLKIVDGNINIVSKSDGIKGKDSLEITGGNISINSNGDSLKSNNKDKKKGFIIIGGGTINLKSGADGIDAVNKIVILKGNINIETTNKNKSSTGIKSTNDVVIFDGNINLNTVGNGIKSDKNIGIDEGNITINTLNNGLRANSIWIKKSNIDINKSKEGIEATKYIEIFNGNININSTDDGINISNENKEKDAILIIRDGNIHISSEGDGVDSNGNIAMVGGNLSIDGPTRNDNFMIDYDNQFQMNGGNFVGVSSNGMAINFSNTSKQKAILVSLNSKYNQKFALKQGNKEIVSFEPKKEYQAILISNNLLEKNKEYKLYIGDEVVETFKITEDLTTIGKIMRPHGMRR